MSAADRPHARPPAPRRRWLRWLVLGVIGASALLSILVLAAHWTISGGVGARFVGARLDGISIPGAGELRVRGFGGDLLGLIRADTIELVDEDGPWLTLTDISLDWRPRALSRRVVQIESLRAGEAVMHRLPRVQPAEPRRSGARGGGRRLPDASLVLDSLSIAHLVVEEDAFGPRGEFAVTAAAALRREGGGALTLNAIEFEGGADAIAVDARLEPGGELEVDAAAGSGAGGLIATLLGAPAGEDARLDLDAAGAAGSGTGTLSLQFGGQAAAAGDAAWNATDIRAAMHIESARWAALRDIAEMAGPAADLTVTLTGYRSEDTQFIGTLESERMDLTQTGAPPTGENLREQGLDVDLRLDELGAWTDGAVVADAVGLLGHVQRDDAGWSAQGTLSGEEFGAFSIQADRLNGPATLRFSDGVLAFTSELQGEGGGGAADVVARMVGPSPAVQLAGEFRAEERTLAFERIAMQSGGANAEMALTIGLRPEATPRLSLDGNAAGLPLGALIPDMQGALGGTFSLIRPARGRPLHLSVEGRATGISGAPDAIAGALGDAADFAMDGDVADGVLRLERATLNAPRLRAGATGSLSGETGYDLDLEAAIQGPVPLPGGVELTGEALAQGAMTGPLDAPVIEARIGAESLDVAGAVFSGPVAELRITTEDGLRGEAAVTADSNAGEARAGARFARVNGRMEAPELTLDWADITLRGGLDAREDGLWEGQLRLRKTAAQASPWPGVLDAAIALSARGGAQHARVQAEGEGFAFPERDIYIDRLRLTADGPTSRLPFMLTADGAARSLSVDLAADGFAAADETGRRAEFTLDAQAGRVAILSEEPVALGVTADGRRSLHAALMVDTGRVTLDYEAGADGTLLALDIEDAPAAIVEAAREEARLAGLLNAQMRFDTRNEGLTGVMNARLDDARDVDSDAERIDMELRAGIRNGRLEGVLTLTDEAGLTGRAEGALPLERRDGFLPVRVAQDAQLTARLSADGPLDTVSGLLLGGEQRLSGLIRLDAEVAGTPRDPRIRGAGSLTEATFDDAVSGLALRDLTIAADFSNDQVRVTTFRAHDGEGGTLEGGGSARSNGRVWNGEVTARVENFRVVNRADAQARLSGELTARVTPDSRLVEGALTINQGEFAPPQAAPSGVRTLEVTEINVPGEEAQRVRGQSGPPIALDIGLHADRSLFVRSENIDVELSVDAHIGGRVGAIQVTGGADVVRGDVSMAGRRFVFDRGRVRFDGDPLDGTLDFEATRADAGLTALIRVTGTPREPRIVLESRPPLPQDEILARVLFGRSATDLSGLEAAQLASALASMAGGGGFDALGSLRSGLGLDRLSFGTNQEGEAQISGGRYLTDDVYFELTTGAQGGAAAQVEWQALADFAIISRFGSAAEDTSMSVRWRTTY